MSAISVRGLERRFGYTPVLRGLDLEVGDADHVAISGPNGSGKTTLLRVLAGTLRPSSGDVHVLGGSPQHAAVRRRIGVISHAPALYQRMTASENIRFWGRMYDAPEADDRGRALLVALGLDPDDRRPVSTYSQGMRQRVSAARAMCIDPEVVLADEPLAGLDDDGATAIASILASAPTVVAAMHDPERLPGARRLALHGGRLES